MEGLRQAENEAETWCLSWRRAESSVKNEAEFGMAGCVALQGKG
jgi:hypothetical protein